MRKTFVVFLSALLLPLSANAVCDATTYTKLEYIESTGTQYIDTGIPVNDYNSFKTRLAVTSSSGYVLSQYNNSLRITYPGMTWFTAHANYSIYSGNENFNLYEFGYDYMNVNGVAATPTADTDIAAGSSVYLFARNDTVYRSGVKMEYIKIFDPGQSLVFHGIPVRRNSDGVLGMCDMVTGNFFTNSGTGDFVAGPIACDAGYYDNNGTCTLCEAGYYCSSSVRRNCADSNGPNGRPQYSAAGSSSCTECPTVTGALAGRIASSYNGWWPNNIHDSVGGCYVYFYDDDPDATYLTRCFYSSGEYGGTNSGCYTPSSTVTCVAGKYKTIESIPEYDSTNQLTYCKGVDCVKGRVCTDVGVGYYSPDGDTVRYACENKPSNSHFACSGTANTREWECDSGYVEYNNACHARCPVNTGRIHADQYSHPLFADKTNMPSPVLHIQYVDGTMCYGYLEPGFAPAGEHGIHIFYNGAVYHAVNPGD